MNIVKSLIVAAVVGAVAVKGWATTVTDNYIVFSCPHCGAEACERELGSYNTFGGVWWSDCFSYAPMAPSPYIATRCWKCQKAFCRSQTKPRVVLDKEYEADGKRMHRVEWVGDYAALKEVLDAGKLKPDAERDVLVQLVWAGNHKDRIAGCTSDKARSVCNGLKVVEIPQEELQSYRRRAAATTSLPLWLRAELLREAGDFDEAKALLEQSKKDEPTFHDRGKGFVEVMEKRIQAKYRKVFERCR